MSSSRIIRKQQCAASPHNESFTPEERACWHIQRISKLVNQLQAVRQALKRVTNTANTQLAKIRTQAQALSHQQVVAERRNRDLEALRLRASMDGVIPTINPASIIHQPQCESKACTPCHCWCGYGICDSCGQMKPRVAMSIGMYGPLVGEDFQLGGLGMVCATCRGTEELSKSRGNTDAR